MRVIVFWKREIEFLKQKIAKSAGNELVDQAIDLGDVKLLVAKVEGFNSKSLRDSVDQLKNKLGTSVIVLATVSDDKVSMVAGVSKDLTGKIKAGQLVNMIAEQVGGKGGGRPDMAMAGGTESSALPEALESVETWVRLNFNMSLIVQKFGGTSVGSAERIVNVAKKVGEFRDQGHDVIVVVSAMSGETNRLTELAREISPQPKPREIDVLLSTGEQVTIALLAMALESEGYEAVSFTGGQIKILTDDFHTKARIKEIETTSIRNEISSGKVVIVAGFQGVDSKGNITTLGRGGSDTTAVALAAALDSDECQIYTDVKGVYTTDPRVVEDAKLLSNITFEEMLELSSLGTKVLQIRAVEFAGKYKVPLRVLSSFEAGPGTH